jgi:uncharacterized protein (DUF362 family)
MGLMHVSETGPTVSVVHTEDLTEDGIKRATFEAIDNSGFDVPEKVGSAFLKVNLRYYWDASTGETTDPKVVSAIIDYLREHGDHHIDIVIAEADASAMRTKYAFKMLGYEKLAEKKNVRIVNLSQCERVEKEVLVNNRKIVLPIAQPMLDADLLINVPKLRTQRLATISCGLKNLFGAIAEPRKVTYHPHLDEVIVGVNKILRPALTVIDGFIALGKWPIKMGLVLASVDQLAADYIAARVMGYDPHRITHLELAKKEGIGRSAEIAINGVKDLTRFSKIFPRENYFLFNQLWNLKLTALTAYLKITNDTRPPVLDK